MNTKTFAEKDAEAILARLTFDESIETTAWFVFIEVAPDEYRGAFVRSGDDFRWAVLKAEAVGAVPDLDEFKAVVHPISPESAACIRAEEWDTLLPCEHVEAIRQRFLAALLALSVAEQDALHERFYAKWGSEKPPTAVVTVKAVDREDD